MQRRMWRKARMPCFQSLRSEATGVTGAAVSLGRVEKGIARQGSTAVVEAQAIDGVRTVADGGGRGDRGGSAGGSREAGGEDSGGADGRGCIDEGEKGVDGAGKR